MNTRSVNHIENNYILKIRLRKIRATKLKLVLKKKMRKSSDSCSCRNKIEDRKTGELKQLRRRDEDLK